MPREYRPRTAEEKAKITDGLHVRHACKIGREHAGLTVEQLALCAAPHYDDEGIGRLAASIAQRFARSVAKDVEEPKAGKPTPAKLIQEVRPTRPRRVVRKGTEMS